MAVAGSGLWLWQDGWFARKADAGVTAFYSLSADAGFKLQDLQVVGRKRTTAAQILEALAAERDMPLLQIEPQAAKIRLEALTWVKEAAVERRFPNVVAVSLREREPLAIWQRQGSLSLIDQEGAVIEGVSAQQFPKLPLVVGSGAPEQTAELLAILESEPALKSRVAAAVWVTERRWNLKLDNGVEVNLPETDPAGAWAQLARVEREQGVIGRDVINIDLRVPNRWVVQTAPDAEPAALDKAAGENT